MNLLPEIAKMLGIELGQEFKVENLEHKFKLTENGLEVKLYGDFSIDDGMFLEDLMLAKLVRGEYKIVKLNTPILDSAERRYLSRIIRPWRNKVDYIVKRRFNGEDYLEIWFIYDECMPFPNFNEGLMYKGMIPGKKYTLEELGL